MSCLEGLINRPAPLRHLWFIDNLSPLKNSGVVFGVILSHKRIKKSKNKSVILKTLRIWRFAQKSYIARQHICCCDSGYYRHKIIFNGINCIVNLHQKRRFLSRKFALFAKNDLTKLICCGIIRKTCLPLCWRTCVCPWLNMYGCGRSCRNLGGNKWYISLERTCEVHVTFYI